MSKKSQDEKDERKYVENGSGVCGAIHTDCPNTFKGTCDRTESHDGSHHCSSCNSVF